MTRDFDQVRRDAAQSIAGRALRNTVAIVGAAWAASIVGQTARQLVRQFAGAPPPEQLRWVAAVVAIAFGLHVVFRALMPVTVAPALPVALVLAIAALAAITAGLAEPAHRAWRHSRLGRLFRAST